MCALENVTGEHLEGAPQLKETLASHAYKCGFRIDDWWIGASIEILKGEGGSEVVKAMTRAFFDKVEEKQFQVIPIPQGNASSVF